MQRRDVLALHLAVDPALALDLAVFLMADRETGGHWNDRAGSSLMAVPPTDPVVGFRTPGAPATLGRQQFVDALERGWTEGETRAERFKAFRALSDDARYAWLGHCVAMSLEASLNYPGGRSCALHDHLGQVLGIEVARWWRPTGANYFDRVPKSVSLAALAEVGGQALADRYAKAKKSELAQACERLFAGELVVDAEVRAAALAWVPEAMRFAAVAQSDQADETPPEEQADEPARAEAEAQADDPTPADDAVPVDHGRVEPSDHDAAGEVHDEPEEASVEPDGVPIDPVESVQPGEGPADPGGGSGLDEGALEPDAMEEAA